MTQPDGTTVSYRNLISLVEKHAESLKSEIIGGPKRIAIMYNHPFQQAISILSALAAGHQVVPLTIHYGRERCRFILSDSRPEMLLSDHDVRDWEFTIDESTTEVPSKDLAFLLYTSGTTGRPKGVMLSHQNIISNLIGIESYFSLSEQDRLLIIRPLTHASALTGELLYALTQGACIDFYSGALFPAKIVSHLQATSCTALCLTPTLIYQMMRSRPKVKLPNLRKIAISGERLHSNMALQLQNYLPHVQFFNVYGLTEASPRVCYLHPDFFVSKAGSVGVPLPNVEVKIVSNSGDICPNGVIGELFVRGPNVMIGYWGEPSPRNLMDGWLCTGDLAYMDEDHFIYIVGRKDDMIIRGGVNVYPAEIEQVLLTHPLVHEVIVQGEPDPWYGQKICITVAGEPGLSEQEVAHICRMYLEPYQRPDRIFVVEGGLEKNAVGKTVRKRITDSIHG